MGFAEGLAPSAMKRDLAERMIALIVDDDDFRRDIVDDPMAAMMNAGLVDDHDVLVDAVQDDPQAQAFAAFNIGLSKLKGADRDAVVYPTWVLGPTCSAPAGGS